MAFFTAAGIGSGSATPTDGGSVALFDTSTRFSDGIALMTRDAYRNRVVEIIDALLESGPT